MAFARTIIPALVGISTLWLSGEVVIADFEDKEALKTTSWSQANTSLDYETKHAGKKSLRVHFPWRPQANQAITLEVTKDGKPLNLRPEVNDHLELWIKNQSFTGYDVTFSFRLHDDGKYGQKPAEYWYRDLAYLNEWTRVVIPFSEYPSDFNWRGLQKITFSTWYPGVFHLDGITAKASTTPRWKRFELGDTILRWEKPQAGVRTVLEVARPGLDEHGNLTDYRDFLTNRKSWKWQSIEGIDREKNQYQVPYLGKAIFRIRSEKGGVLSPPRVKEIEYDPPGVVLRKNLLDQGKIAWSKLPFSASYEVIKSNDPSGQSGWQLSESDQATEGSWYRVRAVNGPGNVGPWSPALRMDPRGRNLLKTQGRKIVTLDGDEPMLNGCNVGSWFVLEPWMNSIPGFDGKKRLGELDIHDLFVERFGKKKTDQLFEHLRRSWIKEGDFDLMSTLGMNLIRIPVHYTTFQSEEGEWIRDESGEIDFSYLDEVIDWCADRGMSVILDLHGSHGFQSREFHTGREKINELFDDTEKGAEHRRRVEDWWREVARHYRGNRTIMGYDLLNEPTGPFPETVPEKWETKDVQRLGLVFDRLYRAIREVDPDHIIIMNWVWYWPQTRPPTDYDWKNVVYSLHYYDFPGEWNVPRFHSFIETIMAENKKPQYLDYDVPLYIGEFTAFGIKSNWDLMLHHFNEQKIPWTFWTYKVSSQASNWGLYNGYTGDSLWNPEVPDLKEDSYSELWRKFGQKDTRFDFKSFRIFKNQVSAEFAEPWFTFRR